MRGEQHCALLVLQDVHELGEHFVSRDRVQTGRRLVENEEARPARQGQQQQRFDVLAV